MSRRVAGDLSLRPTACLRWDVRMPPRALEPFWPSRRVIEFDQWCRRAA